MTLTSIISYFLPHLSGIAIKVLLSHKLKIVRIISLFVIIACCNSSLSYYPPQITSNNVEQIIKNLISKGDNYKQLFPDSALYYYFTGLDSLDKQETETNSDLTKLTASLNYKIGCLYFAQSSYSLAANHFTEAVQSSLLSDYDSLHAESLFMLGEINLENGKYAVSMDFYNKALDVYEELLDYDGIYWTNIGKGILYKKLGETSDAKYYYELAYAVAQDKLKNTYYAAVSHNNIGILLRQIGDYKNSLVFLKSALNTFTKDGNEKSICDCLLNIGNVYSDYKDYERALDYYLQSKAIAESLSDDYRLFACYANLADAYAQLKNDEGAVSYFSKAIEITKQSGDKSRLGEVYVMLSSYYKEKKQYNEAEKYINQSIEVSLEIGDTVSYALAMYELGNLKYSLALFEQSKSVLLSALKLAKNCNLLSIEEQVYFLLANIYEKEKNLPEALNNYKNYYSLKDSLLNREKIRAIEDMEAKYNLERSEKDKLDFKHKAVIANQELANRNWILGIVLVLFLCLVFVFIKISFAKRKEKVQKQRDEIKFKRKIDLLSQQLETKNRELTSKAVMIAQHNDVVKNIAESINQISKSDTNNSSELRKLKNRLKDIYENDSWNSFLTHFEEVHPGFYSNLSEKYPDLSSGEQKICAFLRMNLNTKEISDITGQSIKGIEVARTRIRKKLSLQKSDSLTTSIRNI